MEKIRQRLYSLLGDLPDRHRSISAQFIDREGHNGYRLEKLLLDLNGIEPVPAYFVRPLEGKGPFPAILYNHAHGGEYEIGKEELITGRTFLQRPPYAKVLCRMGYAALCIDQWAFGERQGRSESEIFKQMLWEGQVLWGMMVYDSLKAVDYLAARDDVDHDRLGTLGMSMGSTMSWWLAALDTRIKVCIDICCLTDYKALIESRGLDFHDLYYYVPRLLKDFTTSRINALIAPRPHLSLAGIHDQLTPPAGLDKIDLELKSIYQAQGAPDAWRLSRYPVGHLETAAMRKETLLFLKQWL